MFEHLEVRVAMGISAVDSGSGLRVEHPAIPGYERNGLINDSYGGAPIGEAVMRHGQRRVETQPSSVSAQPITVPLLPQPVCRGFWLLHLAHWSRLR